MQTRLHHRVGRAAALAAALAAASTALGCGEKQELTTLPPPQPLTIALAGPANGLYGGVYAALASGDFSRADLAVAIAPTASGTAALARVNGGGADVAVASEPDLLRARQAGEQLIAIGALVQDPLDAIISLGRRPIRSVSQLAGTTVATTGPLQAAELETVLSSAGVPAGAVKRTATAADPTRPLLSHRVAATVGGFWNYDAVRLELRHARPVVIRLGTVGQPAYSQLVLVVRLARAHRDGPLLREFLQALTRGEQAARANPAQALAALQAADPHLDRRLELAVVERTLSASFPTDASHPFGYQDPRAWQAFGEWMLAHRLLTAPPQAINAVTDEFLPGQGE